MALAEVPMADVDSETQDEDITKDEAASDELEDVDTSQPPLQVPGQKRRRVTRACDECRRKKIKCDGRQPCRHCTVYSYDCTYDQPSHRRRNPGPQYIESLERRLQRAEAVLHTIAPHIDLNDPNLDPSTNSPTTATFPTTLPSRTGIVTPPEPEHLSCPPSHDGGLESMIRATGQMDLDETGHWDYYGHSSGLSFLRRIRDDFGNVLDTEAVGSRSAAVARARGSGHDFTSPRSPGQFMDPPRERPHSPFSDLPPRDVAARLCRDALDDASAILNLVHKPGFYKGFDRIYRLSSEHYDVQDRKYLPLLYSVLALGCLFDKGDQNILDLGGYEGATNQGYKYFVAARNLIDVTDCRDLTSLQAIVFIILFLQCAAKLSTCYSYIGIALRSALRMGLHRSFQHGFSPLEAEMRKRTFWVIRKMDVYVGAMLGLPLTLSDEDFDQDLPAEVEDDHITETAILPMSKNYVPVSAASNANFRLSKILAKIVKCIYPIKSNTTTEQNPSRAYSYSVSFATIYELENDLKTWEEELPLALKPGGAKPSSHIGPMQQLLRMAYAHAQMMLYRPFLHYASPRSRPTAVDSRAYGCAAACVSVSRNVIHITSTMKKEGLLVGSYWFTMYTAFFAVLSLLYFASENPDSATSQEIMRDAREGREDLAQLAKRSMAADRCTTTLTSVFKSLEESLQRIDSEAKKASRTPSRKRDAPTVASAMQPAEIPSNVPTAAAAKAPQRARTFPLNAPKDAGKGEKTSRSYQAKKSPPGSGRGPELPSRGLTANNTPSGDLIRSSQSAPEITHSKAQLPQHTTLPSAQPQQAQRSPMEDPQRSYRLSLQQHHQHQHPANPPQYLHNNMQDLRFPSNLSDLNAMMFPSADPFAYPNQPMTTLQQNYAYSHGLAFGQGHDGFDLSHGGNSNYMGHAQQGNQPAGHNEHVDVRLFGPLPPYLLQPAAVTGYHQARQHLGLEQPGPEMLTSTAGPQEWAEHIRSQGFYPFNYDDVFGNEEEWRGGSR